MESTLRHKDRLSMSTRRQSLERNSNEFVYLARWDQIPIIDDLDKSNFDYFEQACSKKIAFMQEFLKVAALDARHFEAYVKTILKLQSRICAPSSLGFWFWQSNISKFSAGAAYPEEQISIFCKRPRQIDFANVFGVMEYDSVMVRHPTADWTKNNAKKLADYLEWDLAVDGIMTKIRFRIVSDLLFLDLKLIE